MIDNDLIVIEEKAAAILVDRNPKGRELKTCLSIAKLARDSGTSWRYASNIAEITLELKNEEYIKTLDHISRLAEVACEMLDVAIKAFESANPDLADAVCRKDDEADNLYEELYNELLQNPDQIRGSPPYRPGCPFSLGRQVFGANSGSCNQYW